MSSDFFNSIALKWQAEWDKNRIFEANVDYSKPKFFITVPFPYTNSPMHVGHGRTYVTADIYARYLRMKGYNVLFPFAFQFTGTPILAIAESIKRRDKDMIEFFKTVYDIPEDKISELSDALKLAEYFKAEMMDTAKKIGLSIDWRRSFTTTDPRFEKFVQWQLRKLNDLGYLITEEGVVGYCPYDNFPVGMHDTRGDIEPEITTMNLIMFEGDQYNFMVATSRPELIFSVVALMVNPDAKYVVIEYRGKNFIISEKAYKKLLFQKDMKLIKQIDVSEIVKLNAINPITQRKIDIIQSKYVDPSLGTGIVMNYPAHDPFHYLAIIESNRNFQIIPVVKTEGLTEIPAEDVVSKTTDPAELKDFVDSIYKTEYYKGYMSQIVTTLVPDFLKQYVKENIADKRVSDARKSIIDLLRSLDAYETIYEIANGPIYCRCGAEIVVKRIEKQTFIAYDNPKWKTSTLKALNNINFIPESSRSEVEKVIFNLKKEAIGRSRGIGVKLPWDESQIVESLSDSTLYTVLYTIIHKLNFTPNDEILDFIFLGRGNKDDLERRYGINIDELRKEFEYWYPVDQRHSGRDLLQNHIPFYIYNHLAILGEKYLPKRIVINGFVRVAGRKMSKSLRNIYPLSKSIKEFGVDPVRVALTSSTDILQDLDFNVDLVKLYAEQLKRIYDLIDNLLKLKAEIKEIRTADKWLSSRTRESIEMVNNQMNSLNFRSAANILLYEIYNILKEYFDLVEIPNTEILRKVISVWIRALAPFIPHIAEELWHKISNTFVSLEKYPIMEELKYYPEAIFEMDYINGIIDTVKELEDLVQKKAEKIVVYINNNSNIKDLIKKAIDAQQKGISMREFVLQNSDEKISEKIYSIVAKLKKEVKEYLLHNNINEEEIIVRNRDYLLKKLGVAEITIYSAEDPLAPDLKEKKSQSIPLSPSVVII
ncbi:MAG: leucine--tRNA ligase [Saccharolobus sp.]